MPLFAVTLAHGSDVLSYMRVWHGTTPDVHVLVERDVRLSELGTQRSRTEAA
jgi:hypothetical protein